MTNTRLRRLPRAAASLTALLVVLAGVPMALAAVAGARFGSPHPFAGATPPWSWSFGDVESGLSEPLSNETVIDVVLRLALLVGWLGVAVLAATVLTEVAHQIRHRGMPTPHVRGVGWAQAAARWIVAGLIVVPSFVQSPLRLSALDPTEPALTAPSHVVEVGSVASRTGDDASVAVPSHEAPHRRSAGQNPVHVVRPGESVYGIASIEPRSGASSTPARPARKLDSIQATMLTRSLSMPASSTIRKLSTIARIWSPSAV